MNPPKKSMIIYYLGILILIMVLNATIFPILNNNAVTQVDYGTFLNQVSQGKVTTVEISQDRIAYIAKDKDKGEIICVTGRMEDPDLVNRLMAGNIKFSRIIPKENSPLMKFLLTWIVPLLIFIGIGQFLSYRMGKKGGPMGNAMSFGSSNAKVYVEAQTGKSFADVAGQDEAKEALKEIVDFLHNPEKYKDIGAKIPKGALLVGPPGTGKTLMAKAVAGESKVPFFSISGSEFVEMFVGMGAARVRDLFKQAQEKAPCIVFIDEIDAIGKSRNSGAMGGNDEREQTLNQLLTEMDGFSADKGVVILAATNRPESLDSALLRPGRFDRRIPLELPDLNGREAILKVHAANVKFEEGIDFNVIARSTPGASGADLANIINESALRAVKMGRTLVNQKDIEESVEVVIAGYQRKNAVISDKEKKTVAYHEIGHALVAAMQTNSAPVHKITIIPRTSGALGYTMQVEETEQVLLTREQIMNKIVTYMGGRAAEELVFGAITTGASNDISQATKIARAMVTRYGMSDEFGMMALETVNNPYLGDSSTLLVSSETATIIDNEVKNIIGTSYIKAKEILTENRDKLEKLSELLYEKETLTGEEFMAAL